MVETIKEYLILEWQTNEFFSGAFLISLITSFVLSLKPISKWAFKRISRIFFYEVHVDQTTELYQALDFYLLKYNKKYRKVEARILGETFDSYYEDLKSGEFTPIYQAINDYFLVCFGFNFVKIQKERQKIENSNSTRSFYLREFIITGVNKKSVKSLINDAAQYYYENKKAVDVCQVFTNLSGSYWGKVKSNSRDIDSIVLEDGLKNKIIEDVNKFMNRKAWYDNVNVPYKRNYVFYGEPGNGKTSVASAIALMLKRPIYYLSLNNLKDEDLIDLYIKLPANSVLLIEDIDSYFDGRFALKNDLSFSTVLNCMDGVFTKEGVLTFITTNHFEKLDPALKRAGRMDFACEFKNPNHNQIENYLNQFFFDEEALSIDNFQNEVSMAQVVECCLSSPSKAEALAKLFSF